MTQTPSAAVEPAAPAVQKTNPAPVKAESIPPWEEPAPAPVTAQPAAPVQTAPAPVEAAPQASEAETVWTQAKAKILELNPMVYMYVKDTRGVALKDGVLTVEFPAVQEGKLNGLTAPRNLNVAKEALASVRPDTEPVFKLAVLANENEEKLKDLFGSTLTIK